MPIAYSDVDLPLVRDLAMLMQSTQLGELEIAQADSRLRLSRSAGGAQAPAAPASFAAPAAALSIPDATGAAALAPLAAPPAAPAGCRVEAPIVGVAYLAAAPGEAPFIKVGDLVEAGQTLLVIEAMKTLNYVTAPQAGRVAEILVGDGQGVEFDQPLVILA